MGVEPDKAFHIVDNVCYADLEIGPFYANGTNGKAHAALLVCEDMLDTPTYLST